MRSSNDILGYYDDFDDIKAVKDGDRQEVEHPVGTVDFRRFYFGGSNRKNCFSFIFDLGTRSADLVGWYCAPKGKELSDAVIAKAIATVGIKGKHKPERVTYETTAAISGALADMTDRGVCGSAITRRSPYTWHKSNTEYVNEAKYRDFTPEKCATILGRKIEVPEIPMTNTLSDTTTESSDTEPLETKLSVIKGLLDKGLITEDEAAEKRKLLLSEY